MQGICGQFCVKMHCAIKGWMNVLLSQLLTQNVDTYIPIKGCERCPGCFDYAKIAFEAQCQILWILPLRWEDDVWFSNPFCACKVNQLNPNLVRHRPMQCNENKN